MSTHYKFILTNLLACAFVSTASAALGVSVDYTWIAMDQVNKQLDNGVNATTLDSGITGMLDLDMALAPFIIVGAKAGYLYCLPASASYNYTGYNQTTTINASLIPIEVGLRLNFELPATPISITVGIFSGYSFAFATYKKDISALGKTATFTQPFDGNGFIGEVPAAINFKLSSAISLNINGGYRLAKISQMVQSQNVSYTGIPGVSIPAGAKGDILKDSDNNDLAFDFSGYSIGIGLRQDF